MPGTVKRHVSMVLQLPNEYNEVVNHIRLTSLKSQGKIENGFHKNCYFLGRDICVNFLPMCFKSSNIFHHQDLFF